MSRITCLCVRLLGFGALAALSTVSALAQPSLFPPGPPLGPSGRMGVRTEITSIPTVIGVSGSYYIRASMFAAGPGAGITISASNVTIDLMGFTIGGAGFAGSDGITTGGAAFNNITIHDGNVVGWSGSGINLAVADGVHLYNVTTFGNGSDGIASGNGGIVRNCISSMNTGTGLRAGSNCKITNMVSTDNSSLGISTGGDCHVDDSVANSNDSFGILLGPGGVIIGSVASGNGDHGMVLSGQDRATDCTAEMNGFITGAGNGFFVPGIGACSLFGCVATGNAANGFGAVAPPPPGGSNLNNCTAASNGFIAGLGDGINGFRSVMFCSSNGNAGDGIQSANGAHIFRNTCQANGVNGILITSDGNVVEGNVVVGNAAVGITSVGAVPLGNMFAGNRGHVNGGGSFAFPAGETFWPLVGPGALAAAINANSNVTY